MENSPAIPDAEERVRYINEHFAYEVRELLYSALFFVSVQARPNQLSEEILPFFRNMAVEHTLLHARNLLEFYYYKGHDEKYARAEAYVRTWQSPTKTPNVIKLGARVNSEITHLGWKRLDVKKEEKTWYLLDVVNELLSVTREFLSQLDMKFYRDGLKTLETEMKQFRLERHTGEGKPVLRYFDLFYAKFRAVNLV
jgi:hypothetical protein